MPKCFEKISLVNNEPGKNPCTFVYYLLNQVKTFYLFL